MRVVITGATGNVGTSLLAALAGEDRVEEIIGVARRVPTMHAPKTRWVQADVSSDPLEPIFAGADAVVHLAWLIQPSRDQAKLARVNVEGSQRVFRAAALAGVGRLVYASSVGAYSPGPKDRAVDESWPTGGVPTSWYSRHKSLTEQALDEFEDELRVIRLRPGLIFKREAASGVRRLFAGPFLPSPLLHPALLRVLPIPTGLRVQGVHSLDVGHAYRLAAVHPEARGAYNVTADPVLRRASRRAGGDDLDLARPVAADASRMARHGDEGPAARFVAHPDRAGVEALVLGVGSPRGAHRRAARRGRRGDAAARSPHVRARAGARAADGRG
jgi:nucleoside-diphosphate-sugar epimerase